MKNTSLFLVLLSAALTAHAASTPSVQNVRFAQEISATDLVLPPKVLIHPAAVYTDEARRRGIQGNVIVQAYFDENGNASVLMVVKGLGYGLDENVLAAVKDWRFAPALQNGLPVSAVAEIEVPFNIENERLRQTTLDIQRKKQQIEQAIKIRDQLLRQAGAQK